MKDIMLDLETLGTGPGCAIVSIGAVAFDEFGVAEIGFYRACHVSDWETPGYCEQQKLLKHADTISWWQGQSEEARKVFTDSNAMPLHQALSELARYITGVSISARVWGNGADFDNPIIWAGAFAQGLEPKNIWKGYNGRCYRTVKSQFPDIKLVRGGTHHNALDDARSQAEHLVAICQQRAWRLA